MPVASGWADSVVSDLASIPQNTNHTEPQVTILTNRPSGSSIFPPQRVEPVDMPRTQTSNLDKTGYIQSATTDDQQATNSYLQHAPIKRVKHPTDQSTVVIFLKRLSKFCFSLFLSIPCVVLISLILPISWLIRTIIRFTCRYHCPVTPCTCSYLSANDLFWLYNSKNSINQNKNEETTKLNSRSYAPIAAAIFFLEGMIEYILDFILQFFSLGTVNENSLKKLLFNRLITNTSRRGSNVGQKLFPRFSQIILSHFSGTMWIDYSNFSIDEHVREIPRNIQSDEDLQSYISTLLSSDLTHTRPLWQLHYKNRSSARPNDSMIIFLYHPVLSDGISLIRILLKHIVDNRTTQLDLKPRFAGRHGEHIFDYIKAYFFGHMLLFHKLIFNSSLENFLKRLIHKSVRQNPSIGNYQQQQRTVLWSEPFSLTQANRMKLVTRTRMNDLLSTLVISSVKLYLEKHG